MTTILVDQDLCTRCGICSVVCPMGIIVPADENTLPKVQETKAGICIRCGHCEAHCPSQALLVNDRPDEKVPLPAGAGTIASDEMGFYLKKRRSVRHSPKILYQKRRFSKSLKIPGTLHRAVTGSRWNGPLSTTRRTCRRSPG
jgi:ferredoxin